MFATDETLKAKKGIAWLIALAALMALIAIGFSRCVCYQFRFGAT